jgi:rare lipoprotein A
MGTRALKALLVAVVFFISGCTGSYPRFKSTALPAARAVTSNEFEGLASYYAEDFHGRKTANGEVYDMNAMTAAHRSLPFNTLVKVINRENGKSVTVRINDRGPFKDDRIIDLSLAAAEKLGIMVNGTARVTLEVVKLGG